MTPEEQFQRGEISYDDAFKLGATPEFLDEIVRERDDFAQRVKEALATRPGIHVIDLDGGD